MPNGFSFVNDLSRHIGQTVTIFTTSGGQSGMGFTGVLASVNDRFVRLITQLGSAPGCALGNCCEERHRSNRNEEFGEENIGNQNIGNENFEGREEINRRDRERNRFDCSGRTLGSIVDIPIDRIASFVHNAVGSGW